MRINTSNLSLDLQNPRFEPQKSQSEALNTMANDQKDKLIALLRDIISNGLNPSDIPIVIPDTKRGKGYIVLEGNRRVAALKLFKKPDILIDKKLRAKYKKLHDKYSDVKIKEIECLVVETREEADLWIVRKHEGEMDGIGTIRWNTVQKSRYLSHKSGKESIILQLIDFMRLIAENDTEFQSQLQVTKATNIERLMGTPDVRARLGIDYNNGIYSSWILPEESLKGLKAIIKRLSQSDFNVKTIYHKEDRLNFINGIPADELPDLSKKSDSSWILKDYTPNNHITQKNTPAPEQDSNSDDNQKDNEEKSPSKPTTRNKFIPDDFSLTITNDRINRLFSELKLLSHNIHPNVCAVLLRVFIELSVDNFLEDFNLLKNGAVTGAKDTRDLQQKINSVIQKMKELNYMDEAMAKGIKSQFNQSCSLIGIDTLNAYVHNNLFNPIPHSIMLSWDNVQPFVEALWKAIVDNKTK